MPSTTRPLAGIAIAGVVLSVLLVLFGLPEITTEQVIALELGALPLSVSVAAGTLILLQRAQRMPSKPARAALIAGGATSGIGLALMALSYLVGPRPLVSLGQFLVFVGLLVVLLIAVGLQARGGVDHFHLEPTDDEEESARLPQASDPVSPPSL